MKSASAFPRRQRGIAVITAILIAAIVASLAFALSARQRQWLNLVENRNDLAAAQTIALSAVNLSRLTLRDDMRNTQLDHLLEAWTIPVPPINVEEGTVGGQLTELQGRFNLFALQSAGAVNETGVVALQRLLSSRNLPTGWADKMAQAMATQIARQVALVKATPALSAARLQPVANLAELAALAEIEAEKLAALEPMLTILPEATAVNVNFATPEVLMAVTPGLSIKEADRLVSKRARAHFASVQDFVKALPESVRASAKSDAYCVESQYFYSDVNAAFGRAHVRLQALIYRQRSKMPETVWVRRAE